jgi:uncharacterized protein (TIGR02246 family)
MKTDPVDLREFAMHYTASWCSQDAASVAAFFAVEGTLVINHGAPAVGRRAITETVQSFMSAFPDLEVLMDEIVVLQGDLAAYHWTLTGTNTGPSGTGNRVRISGVENWQIGADGLIALSRGRFDGADYEKQLMHGVRKAV